MQNEQSLQQMIREYEANMPLEIMELIKTFDWKKEMRTVVNQNQLMIDIGEDLEQSIYLMILGVVKVSDLYERLTDVHEMPADKAKKVIEEIETLIFIPLHKKLMDLEEKETKQVGALEKQSLRTSMEVPGKEPTRDDILAEIEKDPEPAVIKPFILQTNIPEPVAEEVINPVIDISSTPEVSSENDIRIARPFTLSTSKVMDVQEPELGMGKVAEGVQQDPVNTGLNQPTVMKTQVEATQAPSKSYVADPYREPLE